MGGWHGPVCVPACALGCDGTDVAGTDMDIGLASDSGQFSSVEVVLFSVLVQALETLRRSECAVTAQNASCAC